MGFVLKGDIDSCNHWTWSDVMEYFVSRRNPVYDSSSDVESLLPCLVYFIMFRKSIGSISRCILVRDSIDSSIHLIARNWDCAI